MSGTSSSSNRMGSAQFEKVMMALASSCSNLFGAVMRGVDDIDEVRFKHRGGGEWLVVMKRVNHAGEPEVLFASAFDFVSALFAANAALAKGSWRVDKPWKPG